MIVLVLVLACGRKTKNKRQVSKGNGGARGGRAELSCNVMFACSADPLGAGGGILHSLIAPGYNRHMHALCV